MSGRNGLSGEDRALLKRLVVALEGKRGDKPKRFWERYATPITVLVSAIGLAATVWYSQRQLSQSSDQFDRTQHQGQYSDIVGGLASPSVAVQVNSVRRLVQYVVDDSNFDNTDVQTQAAINAAQTLEA